MAFIIATILLSFILRSAYATPFAEGGLPGNDLVKRTSLFCQSNNVVLLLLRDPKNIAGATTFCQHFIQSTTSTTVTATVTRIVTTRTVTPEPIVLTKTSTTFTTTTAKPGAVGKRWALEERKEGVPLLSYLTKFKEDIISSACSCIVTAGTTTRILTATKTLDGTTTTTAPPSTRTTTVTTLQVVTATAAACSVPLPVVQNGGFEDGDAPWSYGENTPQPDAGRVMEPHTGAYSAFLSCSLNFFNNPNPSLTQVIRTCPGITYDISFYYTLGGDGVLATRFDSMSLDSVSSSSDFKQAQVSFTANGNSGTLDFRLACGATDGVARALIDDIVITPRA